MLKALIGLQWPSLSRDYFLDIFLHFFSDPLKLADSCNSPFKHSREISVKLTHTKTLYEHELHMLSLTWLSKVKYMCLYVCVSNCAVMIQIVASFATKTPKFLIWPLFLCVCFWNRRSVQTLYVYCSHLTALICWPVELELSNPCVRMWTSDTVER